MSEKRGYSPDEAADYLGIAVTKVRDRIRSKTIPAHYDGKDVLVDRDDLDHYFESLPSERTAS